MIAFLCKESRNGCHCPVIRPVGFSFLFDVEALCYPHYLPGEKCTSSLRLLECLLPMAHSWVFPWDFLSANRNWFTQGRVPFLWLPLSSDWGVEGMRVSPLVSIWDCPEGSSQVQNSLWNQRIPLLELHHRQLSLLPSSFLESLTGVVLKALKCQLGSKSWSEVSQSCLTRWDPLDCSPPGSSLHGISQVRVLEWVAISFLFLTLGSNPGLLHQQAGSLPIVPPGIAHNEQGSDKTVSLIHVCWLLYIRWEISFNTI